MIDAMSQARMHAALAHYKLMIEYIGGCTDGGCLIDPPKGMHTNGGCRCFRDPHKAQRVMRAANALMMAVENELK